MLAFVACLNIFTSLILYRKGRRIGITVEKGTRRKAIMVCTTMCILAGSASLGLMFYDIMAPDR